MTIRSCVVDLQTNVVTNIIERGGVVPENCEEHPPEGCIWVDDEIASIGWTWDGAQLQEPQGEEPLTA